MVQDSSLDSVPLRQAIEAFLGCNGNSASAMRSELSRFSTLCGKECPMFALPTAEVAEFIRAAKKPAERRKRTEILAAFFDYAKDNGWVRSNPAAAMIPKKELIQKLPEKKTANISSRQIELSEEGRERIEEEMEKLLAEKAKVIAEVAAAREEGDLSENAGYHDARERLALIEAQLRQRKDILVRAVGAE